MRLIGIAAALAAILAFGVAGCSVRQVERSIASAEAAADRAERASEALADLADQIEAGSLPASDAGATLLASGLLPPDAAADLAASLAGARERAPEILRRVSGELGLAAADARVAIDTARENADGAGSDFDRFLAVGLPALIGIAGIVGRVTGVSRGVANTVDAFDKAAEASPPLLRELGWSRVSDADGQGNDAVRVLLAAADRTPALRKRLEARVGRRPDDAA